MQGVAKHEKKLYDVKNRVPKIGTILSHTRVGLRKKCKWIIREGIGASTHAWLLTSAHTFRYVFRCLQYSNRLYSTLFQYNNYIEKSYDMRLLFRCWSSVFDTNHSIYNDNVKKIIIKYTCRSGNSYKFVSNFNKILHSRQFFQN